MHRINGTELGLSFCVLSLGLMLLISVALFLVPRLWTTVVGQAEKNRIHTLDGARGLLTTWVLSHHLMMASAVGADGVWRAPAGALGVLLQSDFFVAPFFMLTALLFGGRLLARPGQFEIGKFFVKRVFRLVPVYVVAVLILILGAFIEAKFTMRQPIPKIAKEIVRWLLFDFVDRNEINGMNLQKHYGVLWTLRYEILFYTALPALAFLQRLTNNRYVLIFVLVAAGAMSWPFIYFAAGAISALCLRVSRPMTCIGWQIASIGGVAVVCLVASFGISSHVLQAFCLIPTFVCLALELPLFRLLRWRPFRLIGEASYSSYVLHGATMFIVSLFIVEPYSILNYDFAPRMAWLLVYASIAMTASILAFVFIERPFNRLGLVLLTRLSKDASRSAKTGDKDGLIVASHVDRVR